MPRYRTYLSLTAIAATLTMSGCGWLGGPGPAFEPYSTQDQTPVAEATPAPKPPPEPAIAATPAPSEATPPQAKLATGDQQRPGSPAAWGEAALIGAGRSFDAIRFDAGSDELDLRAQQMLREDAEWLRANPRVWLVVAGHCDLASTPGYAYAMGMSRALAVQDFLDAQGATALHVFCISYGNDRPAAPGNDADANALNNRVEIVPFLQPDGVEAPKPVGASGKNAPQPARPNEPPAGNEIPR